MEKLRFPLKPRGVEGAKGVSINFRPQACSPPWRRLGSEVEGSLQSTHWDSLLGRPGLGQNARVPAPSPQGPLLSLGRLGAGFVYSLHAPRARPIRGERRLTSLIPWANRRSSCCSAAKARAGEAGQWLGRVRADGAASDPACGCRPCSARGARPVSSLGRVEGARTVGVPGPRLQGLGWAGRGSHTPAPSASGSGPGRRQAPAPQAWKNSLAWPPRPLQPRGGKIWGAGAGQCAEGL